MLPQAQVRLATQLHKPCTTAQRLLLTLLHSMHSRVYETAEHLAVCPILWPLLLYYLISAHTHIFVSATSTNKCQCIRPQWLPNNPHNRAIHDPQQLTKHYSSPKLQAENKVFPDKTFHWHSPTFWKFPHFPSFRDLSVTPIVTTFMVKTVLKHVYQYIWLLTIANSWVQTPPTKEHEQYYAITNRTTLWVKKQDTKLLPTTSNINQLFKLFFTDRLTSKFATKLVFKYSTMP